MVLSFTLRLLDREHLLRSQWLKSDLDICPPVFTRSVILAWHSLHLLLRPTENPLVSVPVHLLVLLLKLLGSFLDELVLEAIRDVPLMDPKVVLAATV